MPGGLLRILLGIRRALGWSAGQIGSFPEGVDVGPFGFDPGFWTRIKPLFEFLFTRYWRVEVQGIENIPAEGRALLVANHGGSIPWDGIMIRLAVERTSSAARQVHFLVEDFVFHFPFLGTFLNRVGGVRACQDNAIRLLQADEIVGVFPEGVKGIGKLYRDRYRLQRFGRGGFVKLANETRSPIIPVAVVGAEEIYPILNRLGWLARTFELPYLPITPTFPWLGPLGLLPLPSKWLIRFGEPMWFEPSGDGQMDRVEQVREVIEDMIADLLRKRGHPFLGR